MKLVKVHIVARGTVETSLFKEDVQITGSSVLCESLWDEKGNLRVVIYDYGPGVDAATGRAQRGPSNYISEVAFELMPTGGFKKREPSDRLKS